MEDEVYSKMTPESKVLYRKQLLKLAKNSIFALLNTQRYEDSYY